MFKSFKSNLNLTSWLTADKPWRCWLAWNNDLSLLPLPFFFFQPACSPFPQSLLSPHPHLHIPSFELPFDLVLVHTHPCLCPLLTDFSHSTPSLLMTLGSSGRFGHQITMSLINIFCAHAAMCFCGVCRLLKDISLESLNTEPLIPLPKMCRATFLPYYPPSLPN